MTKLVANIVKKQLVAHVDRVGPQGPPGVNTWGSIEGDISDQLDLQAALDLKADISSLSGVAFSGDYNDLNNLPTLYTSADFDNDFSTKTTSDLAEGSNLYFTDQRAIDALQPTLAGYLPLTGGTINGSLRVSDITVGPETNMFATLLTIRRGGVDTGRIDNNASGMRVQAVTNTLFLRNGSNNGIQITAANNIIIDGGISTVDIGAHRLQNVTDPTDDQDAATKKYVDEAIAAALGG